MHEVLQDERGRAMARRRGSQPTPRADLGHTRAVACRCTGTTHVSAKSVRANEIRGQHATVFDLDPGSRAFSLPTLANFSIFTAEVFLPEILHLGYVFFIAGVAACGKYN